MTCSCSLTNMQHDICSPAPIQFPSSGHVTCEASSNLPIQPCGFVGNHHIVPHSGQKSFLKGRFVCFGFGQKMLGWQDEPTWPFVFWSPNDPLTLLLSLTRFYSFLCCSCIFVGVSFCWVQDNPCPLWPSFFVVGQFKSHAPLGVIFIHLSLNVKKNSALCYLGLRAN